MRNLTHLSLVLCLATVFGASARTTPLTISFSGPVFPLTPAENDVAVSATFTNTDLIDTIFLNSDSLSVPGASAVNDEFFTNVPESLGPGEVTSLIEVFRFDVQPNAPGGTSTGTYQLYGGVGDANQFNFDLVASQTFDVNIQGVSTPAAVPEAASFALVGFGLMAISVVARRRRAARIPR